VYTASAGTALIIAATTDGVLQLNYDGIVEKEQILYAIVLKYQDLHEFMDLESDWRVNLALQRGVRQAETSDRDLLLAQTDNAHSLKDLMEAQMNPGGAARRSLSRRPTSLPHVSDLERYRKEKSAILVISLGEQSWPLVRVFLNAMVNTRLRHDELPSHRPVIVLSNYSADEIAKEFVRNRVIFLQGCVSDVNNLKEAGVADVGAVVIFRDEQKETAGDVLEDYNTVYHTCLVDSLLVDLKSHAITICDLVNSESLFLAHHVAVNMYPGHVPQVKKEHKETSFEKRLKTVMPTALEETRDVLLTHPRFAAGQAFTSSDFFAIMLAKMYVFPAVIEMVEALCSPSQRNQDSFVWQVSLPGEYESKPLRELVECWLRGLDPTLSECGPCIVIGLYRMAEEDHEGVCAHSGFSVVVPDWTTILTKGDRLAVLGNGEFGARMFSQRLLFGVDPTLYATRQPMNE